MLFSIGFIRYRAELSYSNNERELKWCRNNGRKNKKRKNKIGSYSANDITAFVSMEWIRSRKKECKQNTEEEFQ